MDEVVSFWLAVTASLAMFILLSIVVKVVWLMLRTVYRLWRVVSAKAEDSKTTSC